MKKSIKKNKLMNEILFFWSKERRIRMSKRINLKKFVKKSKEIFQKFKKNRKKI